MTLIIDDSNADRIVQDTRHLCGCLPRREVYGALPFASTAPVELIPWEQIPDKIADQERNKSTLYHIWLDSKIGSLNQGQASWCWAFSGVGTLMLERELQGLPYVHLSPSSVAGPVVNFQNKGWYIEDCLKRMCEFGVASTEFVPELTMKQIDFKSGWKESCGMNKVTMWQDVGNNAQAQISMILNLHPLAVAENWWSHAFEQLRVVDSNKSLPANNPLRYSRGCVNSWGPSYGQGGYFELAGQKGIADQSYAIEQATFSQ